MRKRDANRDSSYPLPVPLGKRRMAILAEGCFTPLGAKTAVCLVRYVPNEVAAIIDSSKASKRVQEVLGFGGDIPIVSSVGEAASLGANTFALGTAPKGGRLSNYDRTAIMEAIEASLHIVSGMHDFLSDDPEISGKAKERGVVIWDVRKPPEDLDVSSGNPCPYCPVIFTVGSDCNTGKMTAAMEVHLALRRSGFRSAFAASGQTGIMIVGRGIPVDRVIADFIGGATERLVLSEASGSDIVILEGQGSILHPAYAGVTFGMIAGALPHGCILCHQPSRTKIRNYDVPIPPLADLVRLYESALPALVKMPVLGIALNTFDLSEDAARDEIERAVLETGLPATDPVRFGAEVLVEAIRNRFSLGG